MPGLSFVRDANGHRYRAELEGREVAYSEVDLIGGHSLLIKHTEVLPEHEGHGYGSALVRHILDETRRQGHTVMPICPFTADYIHRHPEYLDLVRPGFPGAKS